VTANLQLPKFELPRGALVASAGVLVMSLLMLASAHAGTGGTEFADIYTLISGWAAGTLGKVIAVSLFLVGVAAGIIQQSLMAAVLGVGGALVVNYGPTVIDGIISAVI
jgi:conjugal transfer pilus assembly protein TraA